MSHPDTVLGENYSHKVTAEYDSQMAADAAVKKLVDGAGLPPSQIKVVQPHDPDMARKIEPEVKGIERSLVKSHVTLGLAGLVVGLVLAALLVVFGPVATRSSPVMTFIALGFLCPVLALLLAGALALRPDHDPMIQHTRTATDSGRWTVVVHCTSTEQQDLVKRSIDYETQTL